MSSTAFQDFLLARRHRLPGRRTPSRTDEWADFTAAAAAGWARALHCGTQDCEEEIKAATGATAPLHPAGGGSGIRHLRQVRPAAAYGKRVIFGRAH